MPYLSGFCISRVMYILSLLFTLILIAETTGTGVNYKW
uniref:Uncharacterized protein n=1 Tax=Megaselia scalaris TaxID=36166 RepID=T1GHL7_MEGSC